MKENKFYYHKLFLKDKYY